MAFDVYESFLFTGMPSTPIPHLPRAYTNAQPSVFNNDGTPNFVNAATLVANAIAARATLLIIDSETALSAKIDQREIGNAGGPASQEEIDLRLDSLAAVYRYIKTLTTIPVAWYGLHLRSYYIPVNYYDKGTGAAEFTAWREAHDRWNYRYVGGTLRSGFPVNRAFDVCVCDIYTFFGPDDPHMVTYARENLYAMKALVAGTKPVYGMMWPYFHDTSSWGGQVYPAGYMTKVLDVCRTCEGAVVWGGYGVSATLSNRFTPTTSVKADWQAVTNGSLQIRYGGVTLAVTGMDFSGYTYPETHMDGVAIQIQDCINGVVTTYNGLVPTYGEPGYATNRPYTLPLVTVAWDGTRLVITTGALGDAPYDNYYGRRIIVTGTGSVNTMMGARTEALSGRSTDEFSLWATNQPWYAEVLEEVAPVSREFPSPLTVDSVFNPVQPDVIGNGFKPHL